METDDDKLITRYLLGELTEEEQSRVEERFFADNIFYWKIEAARNELIDGYQSGALTEPERARFDDYFLAAPSRRARVESSRELMQAIANLSGYYAPAGATQSHVPRREPRSRLLVAAAVLVIAVAGGWLIADGLRLRHRLEGAEAEQRLLQQQTDDERAARERLGEQLRREEDQRARLEREIADIRAKQQGDRSVSSIASLTLNPILVRDPEPMARLVIGPQISRVRLLVNFDGREFASYRINLQTVEGLQVLQKAAPTVSGKTILLDAPASLFTEADYLLTLSGVPRQGESEEIATYSFRVLKK